jgi:hypothetical protein
MKCVACGGEGLVGGVLASASGTDDVRFRAEGGSYLKLFLGFGSKPVRAYGCVRCGHLQLAVDFDEKDLRRFLEFKGQQPSVLERLNDEDDGQAGQDG